MCLFPLSRKTTIQTLGCVIVVILCSSIVYGNLEQTTKHRVKRKVVFTSSSKLFFRLNGKLNVLNYTEIVACGYTIRINYDLPSTIQKRYKFFKRDIHSEVTKIPNEEEGMEGNFFKNIINKCQQYETLCPDNGEDISKFSFG